MSILKNALDSPKTTITGASTSLTSLGVIIGYIIQNFDKLNSTNLLIIIVLFIFSIGIGIIGVLVPDFKTKVDNVLNEVKKDEPIVENGLIKIIPNKEDAIKALFSGFDDLTNFGKTLTEELNNKTQNAQNLFNEINTSKENYTKVLEQLKSVIETQKPA